MHHISVFVHRKYFLNFPRFFSFSNTLYTSLNDVFACSSAVAQISMSYCLILLYGLIRAKSSNARYPFFPAPRPTKISKSGKRGCPSSRNVQQCSVNTNFSHGNSEKSKYFSSLMYFSSSSVSTVSFSLSNTLFMNFISFFCSKQTLFRPFLPPFSTKEM